ncbi:hypothetical protein BpHYR1_046093 [Brachionus plicatilis]|uniref:Uncharacterized protein n=1 Tax=Brachionus plicatilis TaxID=10195 RepID=A0A3M7QA61_BRAPC|nr:hypothetical protein BpHYR1_046093 [Brachionus plicatilis]
MITFFVIKENYRKLLNPEHHCTTISISRDKLFPTFKKLFTTYKNFLTQITIKHIFFVPNSKENNSYTLNQITGKPISG